MQLPLEQLNVAYLALLEVMGVAGYKLQTY